VTDFSVGTSGWHYDSWWGPFFPREIRKKDALRYYATRFGATELNAPFYRTPTLEAVRSWKDATPPEFRFAWKASQFITHWKRLGPTCANSIELMETRLHVLGRKAGPVLFQLPPRFAADPGRLDAFLDSLPRHRRYAFEFRHPSWYDDAVLDILHAHDVALCISDHHDAPAPWEVTARLVYVRLHGPGGRYRGSYDAVSLGRLAKRMKQWRRAGRAVHCYFDNDQKSAAPSDASRLVALLPHRSLSGPADCRSRLRS
jgi:uncharacterized protein YecE (DUF72 family)